MNIISKRPIQLVDFNLSSGKRRGAKWKTRLVLTALCSLALVFASPIRAFAVSKTENVILITTDGLRWQEVFTGAEELLLTKENGGVKDLDGLKRDFWRTTPEERRKALMPFLWSEVASKGQLYGHQTKGSVAHITNTRRFSYPGYNEFLTGRADARIDSNNKIPNPNTNVFEWLNTRRGSSIPADIRKAGQ